MRGFCNTAVGRPPSIFPPADIPEVEPGPQHFEIRACSMVSPANALKESEGHRAQAAELEWGAKRPILASEPATCFISDTRGLCACRRGAWLNRDGYASQS